MGLHTGEPQVGEHGYLGIDVVGATHILDALRRIDYVTHPEPRDIAKRDADRQIELRSRR